MKLFKLNLAKRLILLLLAFALLPTLIVGFSLWRATLEQEEQSLKLYQIFAQQMADSIDRNLFERYGDAQAFGLNRAVDMRYSEPDLLTEAMNGYVEKYGLYPLMLFVDSNGRILAANSRGADGEPVASEALLGDSVADEAWFKAVSRGQYTEHQPFTAPGNDQSTGTLITDLYIDERVERLYPGHNGAVIGFAAPVERDGRVLGYWYNMADLETVEEIFESTFQRLKQLGLGSTELTLLDANGTVIIDFDPASSGSEKVSKTDAFLKVNLVDQGNAAAAAAVAGGAGAIYTLHTRKKIDQASGYAHLVGAMGYPGMNWSVMVRTARDEAAAAPIALRQTLIIEGIIIVVLAILAGIFVGRRLAAPLVTMAGVTERMAQGDLRTRVGHQSSDEIGRLGRAIDAMADYLAEAVRAIGQGADGLERTAGELFGESETVARGSTETSERSRSVAAAAEEMSVTLTSVSTAAEQSSDNIHSVAAGADQMTTTIKEIAESAERARGVTVTAVGNVRQANTKVEELRRASDEISRVIDVILEIAEQTKLLALNATIEAARAGEAGKGFAVVASEVKDLAQQTNKATEEIRHSILAIQNSTGSTVTEIGNIDTVISEVSQIVSAIAAAVEEQSVTTQQMAVNISQSADVATEMNRSFTEASKTATEIASDIAAVTHSIDAIDSAMERINSGTQGLSAMSGELRRIIDKFQIGQGGR